MKLSSGQRLGPYEICGLLGAGGMGEVYQARDTRLGRDVAIKVTTAEVSGRFEREARAIAALNHPNISALYDIGPDCLVMEFVPGRTLLDVIASGASSATGHVPVADTIVIGRQIAEALEAAHERGIVHRDLKPANVKITPDGVAKVLDFGLAKALAEESAPGNPAETLTSAARSGRSAGSPGPVRRWISSGSRTGQSSSRSRETACTPCLRRAARRRSVSPSIRRPTSSSQPSRRWPMADSS